jgi:glycosyltransferase involved in cell wall biosynthesis
MRVLMVSDFYPPVIGGLERGVQTLGQALVRRGHEVAVATFVQPNTPRVENDDGVQVHRIDGWSRALLPFYRDPVFRFHPPAPDPLLARRLAALVDEFKPDIVHGHSWMLYSYLAIAGRRRPGVVMTFHDYGFVCANKTLVREGQLCDGPALAKCIRCAGRQYGHGKGEPVTLGLRASSALNRRVDKFIAISTWVAHACAAATGAPERTVVIPSFVPDGVEQQGLDRPRPSFLPATDDYVLFVGALGAHKGVDVLVEADRLLEHRQQFVLIGTPRPDTPLISSPTMTVAHNVAHPDVMSAWRHCQIAVIPSVWAEPFGQVAVEALSCGKPTIVAAAGGLCDIVVNGESGLWVPPGDARALADAIECLQADPALRARLSAAASVRARKFAISAVVDQVELVYEDVIDAHTDRANRSRVRATSNRNGR